MIMSIRNMKKNELIELLESIQRITVNAIENAKAASTEYSDESQSRLAFEVGYLIGTIEEIKRTLQSE